MEYHRNNTYFLNKIYNKLEDMKNIKLMLMAFAAVLLTSATVFAQAPQKGNERANRMIAVMAEELDLTDAQVEQITTIQQEFREKMRALRTSSNGDREAIRAEMQKLSGEQETAIKSVLNEEQITKWESLRAERSGKRPRPGGMNPKGVRPDKMERPNGTVRPKGKQDMKRPAVKGKEKPRSKVNKLKQELGLSDSQAAKMKELTSSHLAKMKELKTSGARKGKIKRAYKKHKAAVKKLLTAEQFEKWIAMVPNKKGMKAIRK